VDFGSPAGSEAREKNGQERVERAPEECRGAPNVAADVCTVRHNPHFQLVCEYGLLETGLDPPLSSWKNLDSK